MSVKISTPQAKALRTVKQHAKGEDGCRTYMPYRDQMATFQALERKGLVQYRRIEEPEVRYSGYQLTEAGERFV